jgi:flagellum-specific ATP synthase
LQSISRVRGDVVDKDQMRMARRVLSLWATFESIEDMVNIGAYVAGVNLEYDVAVQARPKIAQFLQQEPTAVSTLEQSKKQLAELTAWIDQLERALKAQAAKPKQAAAAVVK